MKLFVNGQDSCLLVQTVGDHQGRFDFGRVDRSMNWTTFQCVTRTTKSSVTTLFVYCKCSSLGYLKAKSLCYSLQMHGSTITGQESKMLDVGDPVSR